MNPDRRLEIGRGDGTVVAVPGIAVFVAGDRLPPSLLDVVHSAAGTQPPGRDLARRLAGLLTGEDAGDTPAFGAVADADTGTLVFLSGPVTATTVDGQGVIVELSGSEATTWVDRLLGPTTSSVTVGPDGANVSASTPFELTAGVVPAGWLRMTGAGGEAMPDVAAGTPALSEPESAPEPVAPEPVAPEPVAPEPVAPEPVAPEPVAPEPVAPEPVAPEPVAPEPVAPEPAQPEPETAPVSPPPIPPPPPATPTPEAPVAANAAAEPVVDDALTEAMPTAFESFSLAPDRDSIRAPLPAEANDEHLPVDTEPDDAIPERKKVQGIMCSRHHFNSPDSAYCSSCGISMVHATHNLVTRERPPLGFLVFDDGSTFTLDDRYVLGREPETDPLVQDEQARPIPLDDPEMSVSRVHAEIQLVGWDVQLMDRGSTNGTHLLNDRGDGWDRLAPNQPQIVEPGSRVAVGQRTFVYETPQRG